MIYADRIGRNSSRFVSAPPKIRPGQTSETFRIGCPARLVPTMPQLFSQIFANRPESIIEWIEGRIDEIAFALRAERMEIALMLDGTLESDSPRDTLSEARLDALLPASHELTGTGSLLQKALAGSRFARLNPPAHRQRMRFILYSVRVDGVDPEPRLLSSSFDILRRLVVCGLAFSLLALRPATDPADFGPGVSRRRSLNRLGRSGLWQPAAQVKRLLILCGLAATASAKLQRSDSMKHLRLRSFNTRDTYPEQRLDNDLCQAVVASGTMVFLRGQVSQDLESRKSLHIGNAGMQTRKTMENIDMLLQEAGSCLADVCRTTVYLTDIRNREAVYREMGRWLKGVYPVSTGLVVSGLARPEWLVEIEVTAVIPLPGNPS